MRKLLFLGLLFLILIPINVLAEEVHIYLFYGSTCSICEEEKEFLSTLGNVKVHKYETFYNDENYNLMKQIKELYGITREGVPFTIVGDTAILGFNSSRASKISNLVDRYSSTDYYDRVGVTLGLYEDEILNIDEVDKELKQDNDKIKQEQPNSKYWLYLFIPIVGIMIISFLYLRNKKIKG